MYKLARKIDTSPNPIAYHGIETGIDANMDNFGNKEEGWWSKQMEKAVEAYREVTRLGVDWGVVERCCFI